MTTKAIAASLVMLGLAPLAQAAVGGTLEFEDLVAGTYYPYGSSFMTEGVQVNVESFFFSGSGGEYFSGGASVENPQAAGAGNGMSMGNVNLDFQFPFPLTIIGFAYDNAGGNVNMRINGVLFNDFDLSFANGMNIGGANVSVATNKGILTSGFVTITGNLTQFSVGGQEFQMDDVRYLPTPGGVGLLACGVLGVAARRRR